MSNRSHLPSIRLQPVIYEAWLKENPKDVPGGPLELQPIPEVEDEDAVILESYRMNSEVLPEAYAKNTIIFGDYNRFEGFNIWVTVKGYDYLLMAHQKHSGSFQSADGRNLKNHPHFHELDYNSTQVTGGKVATRRVVPLTLRENINAAQLIEAFIRNYYIEDGRIGEVNLPARKLKRQKGLHEFSEGLI